MKAIFKTISILLIFCFAVSADNGKANSKKVYEKIKDSLVMVGSEHSMYGSGFFIEGGYIVTAFHVVHGLKKVRVQLREDDGTAKFYEVEIIGSRYDKDIAVLAFKDEAAKKLAAPLKFRSKPVAVGQEVFNYSNPYMIPFLFSRGMIGKIKENFRYHSGKGKIEIDMSSCKNAPLCNPEDLRHNFEFKAIICKTSEAPGSSGGIMVDDEGRVIGMTAGGIGFGRDSAISFMVHFEELKKYSALVIKDKARMEFFKLQEVKP